MPEITILDTTFHFSFLKKLVIFNHHHYDYYLINICRLLSSRVYYLLKQYLTSKRVSNILNQKFELKKRLANCMLEKIVRYIS